MGMTIDAHIEVLKSYHNGFTGYAGNLQDSIDVAVDIMRKYQKLQDYMKKLEKKGQYGTLRKLKIVLGEVDNGTDDT